MALPKEMKDALDCAGLAGQAGGLRTAASVLRRVDAQGASASLLSLAKAMEDVADRVDAQALALVPRVGSLSS